MNILDINEIKKVINELREQNKKLDKHLDKNEFDLNKRKILYKNYRIIGNLKELLETLENH